MQKMYCYVDESGQDDTSKFFVVVAVVSTKDQERLRNQLIEIEEVARTHAFKWHKTRHDRRMRYLTLVLERKIAKGDVFTAHYAKPLPYFFPIIKILETAIKQVAQGGLSS